MYLDTNYIVNIWGLTYLHFVFSWCVCKLCVCASAWSTQNIRDALYVGSRLQFVYGIVKQVMSSGFNI